MDDLGSDDVASWFACSVDSDFLPYLLLKLKLYGSTFLLLRRLCRRR